MPELFDFITGSESGAIIAASLVIPNPVENRIKDKYGNIQINKYFASKTSELY